MDIFSVFSLVGGLAFFLYGMNVMSSGLERMAGGRLEKILQSVTSSKLRSLMLGMLITIAVQSSSAVTVMLVGLVNSGIMQFSQTVTVIMGSNIGSTLTTWILAATGIKSQNFFLRLLKPESFSPILAMIGVVLIMANKTGKKRDVGSILVGFSVLMTGMSLMSQSLSPLADSPEFKKILTMFNNPILGVLMGAVVTGVIQSSAASVGILQSLSMTGDITFGMAIPIIMGQNIGTCATALISSIGTNKNAKRVAAVHVYFNVIGTVICLSAFYGLNAFFHFKFIDSPITAVGIAAVHTLFNIVNTVILLPFSKQLEKLTTLTIREKRTKEELLDERLLLSPGLAIAESRKLAVSMAQMATESICKATELMENFDSKKAQEIIQTEETIDNYEDKLGTYLVKVASRHLTPTDSSDVSVLLHAIGDYERIGDHAVNLLRVAEEIDAKGLRFSDEAQAEVAVITRAVKDILDITDEAFANNDVALAKQVEPLEQVIDALTIELKDRHIRRMRDGKCSIEMGFVLSDLLTNYARISDHCSNVGVAVIQNKETEKDTHEYLNEVKSGGSPEFTMAFRKYTEEYSLPPVAAPTAEKQGV